MTSFALRVFPAVLLFGLFVCHNSRIVLAMQRTERRQPAEIPLVKTWKDLTQVTPFKLPGGVVARIGLEAKKCPSGHAVMLYCLTEHFDPPNTMRTPLRLGPVSVSVLPVEEETDLNLLLGGVSGVVERPEELKHCKLLFVRRILIPRPVKYRIEIKENEKENGKVLARDTVEGTDDRFHHFTPWGATFQKHPREPDKFRLVLKNRARGIALPEWPVARPIIYDGKIDGIRIKKQLSEPLPSTLPKKPVSKMKLSISGKTLSVESDRAPLQKYWPDQEYLVRWWVNNKPFIPKQLTDPPSPVQPPKKRTEEERRFIRRFLNQKAKKMQLYLELDLKKLGAKPGDKLSLQLLRVSHTWDWVTDNNVHYTHNMDNGHDVLLQMSNRVDLVAPQ